MSKNERPEERMARQVVELSLGVPVVHHDDGSTNGMVDALIEYPDGHCGALEIIGDHDGTFYGLWRELEKIGHETSVVGLARGWVVVLYHRVRFKEIIRQLPSLLQELEAAGLGDLRGTHRRPHWHLDKQAEMIGVRMAYIADHLAAGRIMLYAEGWSGIAGSVSLAKWVADVLAANPDVAAKLARHGNVSERHVFIWSTMGSEYAVQFGLENRNGAMDELDLSHPVLPEGITHVWIAGTMSSQGAIAWSPERGWWRTPWQAPPRRAALTDN